MLNTIKIFDGTSKSEFTSWVQSVENAARLCNLDTLNIALSKLQGPPLKSPTYLELKEINSGKQLHWHSVKKHLTSYYSEIFMLSMHMIVYIKVAMSQQLCTCTGHKTFSNKFPKQVICPLLPLWALTMQKF